MNRGFLQFSDLRLKTDIQDIVDAVDIVSKLSGKTYEWKPSADFADDVGMLVEWRVCVVAHWM